MNLGELGENGQLKVVENVNELYDMWKDLKKDEIPKGSVQETGNAKDKTVDM